MKISINPAEVSYFLPPCLRTLCNSHGLGCFGRLNPKVSPQPPCGEKYAFFLRFTNTLNFCFIHPETRKKVAFMSPKDADDIANSADPDQTAPLGAV